MIRLLALLFLTIPMPAATDWSQFRGPNGAGISEEASLPVKFGHDGKLAQEELPKEWQPTGSWGAIDLDRNGLLNERDWNFFRTRRAAQNSLIAVRLVGKGDVTDTNVLWRYSKALPDVPCPLLHKECSIW